MLAADAKLDAGPRFPPAIRCDLDEFTHTFGIE